MNQGKTVPCRWCSGREQNCWQHLPCQRSVALCHSKKIQSTPNCLCRKQLASRSNIAGMPHVQYSSHEWVRNKVILGRLTGMEKLTVGSGPDFIDDSGLQTEDSTFRQSPCTYTGGPVQTAPSAPSWTSHYTARVMQIIRLMEKMLHRSQQCTEGFKPRDPGTRNEARACQRQSQRRTC